MRIARKFIQLTRRTYPYGTEQLLEHQLPDGYDMDSFGNYFLQIGDNPTTMFTCHLDTAASGVQKVNHIFDRNLIKTDGTSILGADDKAGMVVLLYMIEQKVPGLYFFFLGEERGCIGSGMLSKDFISIFPYIRKVVSFDRRGKSSIITHQMSGRCCSDDFAEALSAELNIADISFDYSPDDSGIYTDSAEFVDLVSECTNISVGYQNEHTFNEVQDINHLVKLCKACVKVDWESLPTVREPGDYDIDYGVDNRYFLDGGLGDDDFDDDDFDEPEYLEDNTTYINYDGNKSKKVYVATARINYEKERIYNMLKIQGYSVSRIVWDGYSCYIQEGESAMIYLGNRSDLIEFIPELVEIPSYYIKDEIPQKKSKVLAGAFFR